MEPPPRPAAPRPQLIVLAGANGAGKSTAAPDLLRDTFHALAFVNADEIARGLSAFTPERQAMAAGRVMRSRLLELIDSRSDFAFETTLAGRGTRRLIEDCAASGYDVHLVYLWPRTPELALERVRTRVAAGGHDVPEADVRRRFFRGVATFVRVRPTVASWYAFDTGSSDPRLIARGAPSEERIIDRDAWSALTQQASAFLIPGDIDDT